VFQFLWHQQWINCRTNFDKVPSDWNSDTKHNVFFQKKPGWSWSGSRSIFRQLSQESSVSKVFCIHSHKTASFATIQIKELCKNSSKYCAEIFWFQIFLTGSVKLWVLVYNPLATYFTNETWFYFRSHVNTQQTLVSRKLHTTIQGAMTLKLG